MYVYIYSSGIAPWDWLCELRTIEISKGSNTSQPPRMGHGSVPLNRGQQLEPMGEVSPFHIPRVVVLADRGAPTARCRTIVGSLLTIMHEAMRELRETGACLAVSC